MTAPSQQVADDVAEFVFRHHDFPYPLIGSKITGLAFYCFAKMEVGVQIMPVLTKEQVVEAAFELLPEEREEVAVRINGDDFELTEEQKNETRRRIADDRHDPSTSISRDELMAQLRGTA